MKRVTVVLWMAMTLYSNAIIASESTFSIPLRQRGGVYEVMATLNSELKVYFIVDTGAADVTISESVAKLLAQNESLTKSDIKGDAQYQIADGNNATGKIVNIKSIDIGGHKIYNVRAVVMKGEKVPLLLGQSALKQLGVWSINAKNNRLDFNKTNSSNIENKSNGVEPNRRGSSPTSHLLCTGAVDKTKDTVSVGKEPLSVDLEIDFERAMVMTNDDWGCLADIGLVGTHQKLTGCKGDLAVSISDSEVAYDKSNSGDLYHGTGSFTINRSSGIMSVDSVALAMPKAQANWAVYLIVGKLQCKKIERQF